MSTVVLGALWALWPLAAFVGGQAYSVLSAVAALTLLPFVAKSVRPRLYFIALVAFFIYSGASSVWSPRDQLLIEIDFDRMRFAVRSEMLRVGLQILAQGLLIAAALRLDGNGQRRVQAVAHAALALQLCILLVLTLFEQQLLTAFSALVPDTGESVQNISRNSLIMAVAAPLFAIGLAGSGSRAGAIMAMLMLATVAAILAVREVNAGLLALIAAAAAVGVVHFFPRDGFKLLGVLIAAAVMSAPWSFGLLSEGADFATANDSTSYRAAIWQRVIVLINEQPVIGNGLGSLRTIREPIEAGVFAGQFTVPNHAHNMMLQLWAETGAIGAGLLSLAIVLAGWRLPDARRLGPAGLKAAAIAGAMTAIAAVSFDIWNEWWWAVGGLLAVLAVATPRIATRRAAVEGGAESEGMHENRHTSVSDVAGRSNVDLRSAKSHTDNNFNLLRLIFAVMVVAYHLVLLPGVPGWQSFEGWSSVGAELGVQGFFVLSGYLVWASLERTTTLGLYAEKRARRLLPGYFAVIIATVAAALIFTPAVRADLSRVGSYLGWNLAFLNFMEPALPGLFEGNRFNETNGALWTLKIEILFYLVLPLLALALRAAGTWRWALFLLIYIGSEAWRVYFTQGEGVLLNLSRQLPGQMSFFITGIALCAWREELNWRSLLAPLGLALLVISITSPQAEFARAAGLGIVVVWLGVGIPKLFDAARFGDLSYGLYIVHFPIIQCIVAAGLFVVSPGLAVGLVAATVLVSAMLLWWLVERPALRRDSAYRITA